jgi:hypothetical protein
VESNITPMPSNKPNPVDYQRFLDECCEVGEGYTYPKDDVLQAHRIWCGSSTSKAVTKGLREFISSRFPNTVVFVNDVKRNSYKGMRLRPLTFQPREGKDYEQFIVEKCQVGYLNRISYRDFFIEFLKWKTEKEPFFVLTSKYKKDIQNYLESTFAGGRVHLSSSTKTNHLFGVWGVGMEFNGFGKKDPDRKNKPLSQVNAETGHVIRTWDSLSLASRDLKIPMSTLSNYARFKTNVAGSTYRYHPESS